MSKSNAFETDILNHIFTNAAIALVGDATGLPGAATVGNLYLGLHTADPGEAGDQTTNEATYTGYARLAVPRNVTNWTVTGNSVTNALLLAFAACTSGANTITHWVIGTSAAGAGKILYSGSLGTANMGAFTGKASTDVITAPGHTLVVGDTIAMYAIFGKSLPTGITEGTTYFVKTVATNDITISATSGGATLDITADGEGIIYKVASTAVSNTITPQFAAGQINVSED